MDKPKRLEQMTRDELLVLAKGLGVSRPGTLTRNELIKAVTAKQKLAPRIAAARQAPATSGATSGVRAAETNPPVVQPSPGPPATRAPLRGKVAKAPRPFAAEELRQLDARAPHLPQSYGENRVVLLPRDPWWLYAYWDLREDTLRAARERGGCRLLLRLHELGGAGAGELIAEQELPDAARSWYLNVPRPRSAYRAEIGMRTEHGEFLLLAASNAAVAPPAAPSTVVQDEFVRVPFGADLRQLFATHRAGLAEVALRGERSAGQLHETMYRAAGIGADTDGATSAALARMPEMGSARVGSFALASEALARGPGGRHKSFWLVADAELIVFGATEPDARLEIGGEPVALRADGTFSLRFAFPDGRIPVPIEAVAADGEQRRAIRFRFERTSG